MAFSKILSRMRSRAAGKTSEIRLAPPPSDRVVSLPEMDGRVQKFQSRFGRNSYLQRRSIIG